MALLGSNGAGKSTLVKILTGVYTRDAGTVKVDGEEVVFADPRAAVAAGVRLLPQEISVMPRHDRRGEHLARRPAAEARTRRSASSTTGRCASELAALLDQLGFGSIDPDMRVKRLSVAEQRIVEIARALAGRARILVMDEPTAALTEQEAKLIFRIIRRLKEQSVAVIYISHYLNEVFEISDRIAVLRDGRNAGLFETAQRLARRSACQPCSAASPATSTTSQAEGASRRRRCCRSRTSAVAGQADGIASRCARGEIVGVFGLIGSGIEVLGRAIYGALGPVDAGHGP